jgi:hypothetical protein
VRRLPNQWRWWGSAPPSALAVCAGWLAAALLGSSVPGCVSLPHPARSGSAPAPAAAEVAGPVARAWRALVEGRHAEADRGFTEALGGRAGGAPASAEYAHFGRAVLAFERGDVFTALEENLVLLEQAAAAGGPPAGAAAGDDADRDDDATGAVRAMAAGRLAVLMDEYSEPTSSRTAVPSGRPPAAGAPASVVQAEPARPARDRVEDRILALLSSRVWTWRTRRELVMLSDAIARRRDDPALLDQVGRAGGCVRAVRMGRRLGFLPHLDLDRAAPDEADLSMADARTAHTLGCHLSVPADPNRPAAERVLAELDAGAPPAGAIAFDLVLDSGSEARLLVDGGKTARHAHGDADRYGPRVSAVRVTLTPGKHSLELRLASYGGRPSFSLMAFRVESSRPGSAAEAASAALPPGPGSDGARDALAPARWLAELYSANRLGDAPTVWRLAARLEAFPRFAIGRALLGAARRDDPSVPANVARDRARARWLDALAVDPGLARAHQSMAGLDLEDERPRGAIDSAREAARARPDWWLPQLTLFAAYRLRGLDDDADRALARAIELGGHACAVIESALGRAEDRRDAAGEARWSAALGDCPSRLDLRLERLRKRGELAAVIDLLGRARRLSPDNALLELDLASALLAEGRAPEAVDVLSAVVEPDDPEGQLRLADALAAARRPDRARAVVRALLERRPDSAEAIHAARVLGLPLPLDAFRLDGRDVIARFEASGRRYQAPAVVVLDRTVSRVFPDGAELTLTHEIVRVQSKDAIEKWGEVALPEHAEVLTVRTHKADGSTREPEEVAGKESVSAADLAIGDYVEKETLELRAPDEAFLGVARGARPANMSGGMSGGTSGEASGKASGSTSGYVGERFYFQSFDAPLDRTEYLVVTDADEAARLSWDVRAGAPAAVETLTRPPGGPGSLRVTTFARQAVAQRFAERSAVPAIEIVPSVRAWRGVTWDAWARFLSEQTYGNERGSWGLDEAVAEIRAEAGGGEPDPEGLAAALVAWTGLRVEDDEDLRESASFSVARGRGNRVAVIRALARRMGLGVDTALARSRLTTPTSEPPNESELDDFSEPLVRFRFPAVAGAPGSPRASVAFVDARLKHAPFGYLPPSLDGAPVLLLDTPGQAWGGDAAGLAGDARPPDAPPGTSRDISSGGPETSPTLGRFSVAHALVPALATRDRREVELAVHLDARGAGTADVTEQLLGWPALEWAELLDRMGGDREKIRQDFEQRWLGVQFGGAVLEDLTIDVYGQDGHLVSHRAFPAGPGSGTVTGKAPGPLPSQAGPYSAARVRLVYTFTSPRMATVANGELRIQPTFFRSQPGRRYASEPGRETTLIMGPEFPFELRARIDFPAGARIEGLDGLEGGAQAPAADSQSVISRPGGYEFAEQRSSEAGAEGPGQAPAGHLGADRLVLRRRASIPILRISPADYPRVAAQLRQVDSTEQREIRVRLRPLALVHPHASGAAHASSGGP